MSVYIRCGDEGQSKERYWTTMMFAIDIVITNESRMRERERERERERDNERERER